MRGPAMTCQRCRDEASVHLTESVDGTLREVHLCPNCARGAGLPVPAVTETPDLPLDRVIQTLISAHVGELVGRLARTACPRCGLRFMEYRTEGMLGCPHDYEVFAEGLVPLIKKAQAASRHVGKRPRRTGGRHEGAARLRLRAELRDAVRREDYESAASLRDQLRPKDAR